MAASMILGIRFVSICVFLLCSLAVLGGSDFWPGRSCCHLSLNTPCQNACQRANSRSDLRSRCRANQEPGFFSCIERQEESERCCSSHESEECQAACKVIFLEESVPTEPQLDAVSQHCDSEVNGCVLNYTTTEHSRGPADSLPCCDESNNIECQSRCREILTTMSEGDQIMDALTASCGALNIMEQFWQCFLRNFGQVKPKSEPTQNLDAAGIDGAKLLCCRKAKTSNCRDLCLQTYSHGWSHSWNRFYQECGFHDQEKDLNLCLLDVDEPCQVGCAGLDFCSNFNNRPNELFRSCNTESDQAAQQDVYLWQRGLISLPLMDDIPVHNLYDCRPEVWKAIACTLHIKPCHTRTATTAICRSDCVQILSQCVDWDRLPSDQNAGILCNRLAPHDNNCIALTNYIQPSDTITSEVQITQPCKPNPCANNQVCVINRRKCKKLDNCRPYVCKQGCQLGDVSTFLVPHKSMARLSQFDSTHCYNACRCSHRNNWAHCQSLGCVPRDSCLVDMVASGERQDVQPHRSEFMMGCRQCVCYAGEVLCLEQPCRSHGTLQHLEQACNCHAIYEPVCTTTGQTFPNECIARCVRQQGVVLSPGTCHSEDPCQGSPCGLGEICIPWRQVCLTSGELPCRQYQCVSARGECNQHRHEPVCDTANEEFSNACLLKARGRQIAYQGHCQTGCMSTGEVCGYDGETYPSECAAWGAHAPIDYTGRCRALPTYRSEFIQSRCRNIPCPVRSFEGCHMIHPPGGCCPLCAAIIRVLFSTEQVDHISTATKMGPLTVLNITSVLSTKLSVSECDVFGYLSPQRDLVLTVLPVVRQPTQLQMEVCITEAEKLGLMLQFESTHLYAHLQMAPLVAAFLQTPITAAAAGLNADVLVMLTLCSVLLEILPFFQR